MTRLVTRFPRFFAVLLIISISLGGGPAVAVRPADLFLLRASQPTENSTARQIQTSSGMEEQPNISLIDLNGYIQIGRGRQSRILRSPDGKKIVRVFRLLQGPQVEDRHVLQYVDTVNTLPERLVSIRIPRVGIVRIINVPEDSSPSQYGVMTDFVEGQTMTAL